MCVYIYTYTQTYICKYLCILKEIYSSESKEENTNILGVNHVKCKSLGILTITF